MAGSSSTTRIRGATAPLFGLVGPSVLLAPVLFGLVGPSVLLAPVLFGLVGPSVLLAPVPLGVIVASGLLTPATPPVNQAGLVCDWVHPGRSL
jgi:hypothetical protein